MISMSKLVKMFELESASETRTDRVIAAIMASLPGTHAEICDKARKLLTNESDQEIRMMLTPNAVGSILNQRIKQLGVKRSVKEVPYGKSTTKVNYWSKK